MDFFLFFPHQNQPENQADRTHKICWPFVVLSSLIGRFIGDLFAKASKDDISTSQDPKVGCLLVGFLVPKYLQKASDLGVLVLLGVFLAFRRRGIDLFLKTAWLSRSRYDMAPSSLRTQFFESLALPASCQRKKPQTAKALLVSSG